MKHTKGNPAQLVHTNRTLGRSFHEIQTGKGRGQYPALDRLIPAHPDICTPDCRNRQPQAGVDVYPSIPERMARIEGRMTDIPNSIQQLRHDYRQDDHNLETRIDGRIEDLKIGLHARIDRDIMPKIKKRIVFNTLVVVGLVVAGAINVIVLYKYFNP